MAPSDAPVTQVVDGEGVFKETELQEFAHGSGLVDSRTSYQVVAIMGPQSSGKSTLLNHVVCLALLCSDRLHCGR